MMRQIILSALLLLVAAEAGHSQSTGSSTFPYRQNFDFVTAGTTSFPAGSADGSELGADANTPALWPSSAASHGINNNGGAGGALRLQSTAGAGAAGFVWSGSFTCRAADSLAISWAKSRNGASSTRLNELRVATNNGAGSTFADLPLSYVAGGEWPSFDNGVDGASGRLRVKLPSTLDGATDARIRIYSVNVGGSGSHPRVVVDSLEIIASDAGMVPEEIISPIGVVRNISDTLQLRWAASAGAAGYLIVARRDSTPVAAPLAKRVYRAGDRIGAGLVLSATSDTSVRIVGLPDTTAFFIRIYPFRGCDSSYGPPSPTLAVATPGDSLTRRFPLLAGRADTIAHAGAIVRFISAPTADGSILLRRRSSPGSEGLPMHRNGKQPVDRLAGSWWEIRATGLGRFSAEVAADISGIPGISRADDLAFVYRLRGNLIWGDILSTGVERDRDGLRVVTRGVDRFGDFAIGAAGSVNVLPVTLLSFDGISLPGRSLLRWETAQEIASSGFRLSRSRWLENRLDSFALLGTIAARGNESGNESGRARYEYLDELGSDAGSDHIYIYRLEETSLAGETVELARVRLRGEPRPGSRENDPALWPNPVAGRRATLRLPRSTGEPVRVDIHSEKGSIVREISDPKRYTGEERIELDLAGLPAGLYLCTISVGDFIVSHPLILLP